MYEGRSSMDFYRNQANKLAQQYKNISVETVPNTGHEDIVTAFKTTNIIQWMLNQTR